MLSRFRRLFELYVDSSVSAADMRRMGWRVDGQGWRWRRRLFAREENHLRDCSLLFGNNFIPENVSDKWIEKLDPIDGYSVKMVYNILRHFDHHATNVHSDIIGINMNLLKSLFVLDNLLTT